MSLDTGRQFALGTPLSERGLRGILAFIVASVWTVYTLVIISKVLLYTNITIPTLTHRVISTGLICMLVYLLYPATKGASRSKLGWSDIVPIVTILAGCAYVILNVERISAARVSATGLAFVLSVLSTVFILEAVRRVSGPVVTVMMVFFFFYGVYSNYFPGMFHGLGYSYPDMLGWVFLSTEGIWGPIIETVTTVVAGFIIFGAVLRVTTASDFFTDVALALGGTMKGGPAKAAVITSGLFGTLSGSVSANVATTGTITIPLMKSTGYPSNYAGAVESAASTGGIFMPPVMGAVAFLVADFLGVSYWKVVVAGFIPAVLYYVIMFCQIHFDAVRMGMKPMAREQLPDFWKTLRRGWQFLLPIVALVYFLGVLQYSAWTSVTYTLAVLVVISLLSKRTRLTPGKISIVLEDSARGMINVIPVCAALGILMAALIVTGLSMTLSSSLVSVSGNNVVLLLFMAAAASFVLGMGATALACYLVTVILVAPALVKLGVVPIAAHMFLFYMGTISFITPPVAIACFVACGISGGSVWKTGWKAVRLAFAAFLVPWMFVWNPALLAVGPPADILLAAGRALIGAVAIAAALSGYFFTRLRTWECVTLIVAGILLYVPSFVTGLTGLVSVGLVSLWNYYVGRTKKLQANRLQQSGTT